MRVLAVHADLGAGGGAEAYAEAVRRWLIAAGHRVDTLDIHGLRSHEGPRTADPRVLRAGRLPGLRQLHLLKHALVCRALPRIAAQYEAVILCYGEGPALSCPTLTIRHAPALFSLDPVLLATLGGKQALRRPYAAAAALLAGVRGAVPGPTIVNSRWTRDMALRTDPRLSATVVYPHVYPPEVATVPRDPLRILALGRIVPNKRLETAVAITAALRDRGLPVRLDIAGRAASAYARRFLRRTRGLDFVHLYPDADRTTLARLLAQARFGLHCYRQEHFGIAVAEMILAGVLPLVHDGGGVRELVTMPDLRFSTTGDAVSRFATFASKPMETTDAIVARLQQGEALGEALDFDARLGAVLSGFLAAAAGARQRRAA